jgi:phosphoenolpyruvate carboxylase
VTVLKAAGIAGFRSETIAVCGVRLHYWIGGDPDGQPVVLWHGFYRPAMLGARSLRR